MALAHAIVCSHYDCCNAPCRLRKVEHFLRRQRPPKNGALTVGEPLLEDLVAAEFVAPDGGGDVAPVGVGVQVDVERGLPV